MKSWEGKKKAQLVDFKMNAGPDRPRKTTAADDRKSLQAVKKKPRTNKQYPVTSSAESADVKAAQSNKSEEIAGVPAGSLASCLTIKGLIPEVLSKQHLKDTRKNRHKSAVHMMFVKDIYRFFPLCCH